MAPIRRPGGWVVPGFKYLGPFNPLNNGEPVNAVDRAAQKHDFAYDSYLKENKNPYYYFNKADSDFLEDLESDRSFGGWIGKTVFGLKKAIAPSLGEPSGPEAKRARLERAQKRKLYFARSNKGAKQPRMDTNAGEGPSNAETSTPTERAPGASSTGGGGGAGSGKSVGVSTGGWKGGTLFTDTTIVTRITRQWYAPIYNGHLYKRDIASDAGVNNSQWVGITTPWGYFDFNSYSGHFSPQEWQRLTNEYKKWRPKSMRIKIYNLQIKQVVTLGADTLYNNDLTAGVHIFCDGSHQYPYPQNPWNEGVVPELPNDVWKLPQYAYYQYSDSIYKDNPATTTPMNLTIRKAAPLYMLESSSHEVLRTGEETQFHFTFDSGWVSNDRCYAPPQSDYNPKVGTRRWFPVYQTQGNTYTFTRFNPYKKPTNIFPGPGMAYRGFTGTGNAQSLSKGPCMATYIPPQADAGNDSTSTDYGGIHQAKVGSVQKISVQTAPVNGACSRTDYPTLAFDVGPHNQTDDRVTTRNQDIDMSRWNGVYIADGSTIAENKQVWMYPNQAWNSTPICRGNPIWQKAPNLDRRTMWDSSDGTLMMQHPPGTIFIKTQKIPIPTENNADTYLNLYVTGQVTCEIEWECERFQTKNWRPEIRNDAASMEPTDYDFDVNGVYNMPTTYKSHMPTRMGMNAVL
nr:MAG: structural protein 3 [Hedgehog bocavirus]UMO75514.1 MAG: structural protein 3 [Hedgehog bocavirus]